MAAAGKPVQDDPKAPCRLYLITPPVFETKAFSEVLKAALGAGDVACVQLRLKDVTDDHIMRTADALMPLAQRAGAAFILNDRPDLAQALGADGVHVGQDDMPYAEARRLVGPDAIVGVTCHDSRHLAMEAGEAGADYVAFGAFFPTATKDAKSRAPLELVSWWSEMMTVPQVAIGGITTANCTPLVSAGADFLAVSAGVWQHAEGPAAAVAAFNRIFDDIARQ
ncbi:thiamine phosphate synthase [Zavarzinia aquatilis]|uniref:Thiamine-phosphate synthase n=1 Tax=Zavarzinia aquatilis TaxID=2211142 RepID=A0A317E2D1_9PROT|nr:thiamine phosphate synthase [Zavarzinia aquatilis]PWR20320.1 thiamine phosphate synthase [Zavarzinia aquatilis]